jgi:hypothetical protein
MVLMLYQKRMRLSMDEAELLGRRLDNVNELLKQPLSEWARNYWMTVHQQLIRKLHVENNKDPYTTCSRNG